MNNIHPTNIIANSAKIGNNVTIGAYNVIEDDVVIGGNGNGQHARGGSSDDGHAYRGKFMLPDDEAVDKLYASYHNTHVIAKFVTLNRGTSATGVTIIGDDVLIMTGVHVAHDCIVGNNIIMANQATIAGHVCVDDYVVLGGLTGIHQFCKIGAHVITMGGTLLGSDVPPYVRAASRGGSSFP